MRKSRLLSLWTLSSNDSRVTELECHPGTRSVIGSIMVLLFSIAFVACGGDSSTSVNDGDGGSEAAMTSSSRHSGPGPESSSSKKVSSSSSSTKIVSSSWTPDGGIGSSNSTKKPSSSSKTVVQSSSSRHSGLDPESSSGKKDGGSSSAMTSLSSSSKTFSSSSEYVPFDHSKTHANASKVGKDAYKLFTDPRNGRSYYYIKIIGKDYLGDKDSVTIMAENLNIGEMVLGKNDQNDDTKIERYCYNNDTTKCDEFGGLYQWAEMMQLPSRCNTESCSDLIQENHQGICPNGWRLMTDLDFYIAWHAETNEYGIKGTCSAYGFGGNNYSGLSLTGAGMRNAKGGFDYLREVAYWYYPIENKYDYATFASLGYVTTTDYTSNKDEGDVKTFGLSVRCVKLE